MEITKKVLCCNDCGQPVEKRPDESYYCRNCDYTPELEDLVFVRYCPKCGQKVKNWNGARKCDQCHEIFEK